LEQEGQNTKPQQSSGFLKAGGHAVEITRENRKRQKKSKNTIDSTSNAEITSLKIELDELLDKKEMLQTQLVSERGRKGGRTGHSAISKYDELISTIDTLDVIIRNRQTEIDTLKAKNGNQQK
jgi:hypothetical protein